MTRFIGTDLRENIKIRWDADGGYSANVDGGLADEYILGGGNDRLVDVGWSVKIDAGAGNDQIRTGKGDDVIFGGTGNDTILSASGDDLVYGGNGNDRLYDWTGSDFIDAGAGDDIIFAHGRIHHTQLGPYSVEQDNFRGGSGFDTLDLTSAGWMVFNKSRVIESGGLVIDVSKQIAHHRLSSISFSGFEEIIGTGANDTYKGSSRSESFAGGYGNDVIRGLGGADTLSGGQGVDTFVWLKKDVGLANGVDIVTDLEAHDSIDISDFYKDQTAAEMVRFTTTETGTLLSVNTRGTFVDVAHFDGVFDHDAIF